MTPSRSASPDSTQRAARMEAASGRDRARVGDLAGEDLLLDAVLLGDHRQQRLGVRVLRSLRAPLRRCRARRSVPRYITAMRSAMFHARPRSWVTATIDSPTSSTSERSSARISPRIEASSDATGSSASSSCGRGRSPRRSARAGAAHRRSRAGSGRRTARPGAARPAPARRRRVAPRRRRARGCGSPRRPPRRRCGAG